MRQVLALSAVLVGVSLAAACGGGKGSAGGTGGTSTPTSILAGQTQYSGALPSTLIPVTYTGTDGITYSSDFAFSGWVTLIADTGTSQDTIQSDINAQGGAIIDSIPLAGIYTISLTPGQEGTFSTAMASKSYTFDVYPTTPIVGASQVGSPVVIDNFSTWGGTESACKMPHGKYVESVIGKGGGSVIECPALSKFEVLTNLLGGVADTAPQIARHVIEQAEDAQTRSARTVINLSLQSAACKAVTEAMVTPCKTESPPASLTCRSLAAEQGHFLGTVLSAVEHIKTDTRDNVMIVISAGNCTVDLSTTLARLKTDFPEAFKHVVIAGGTDAAGAVDPWWCHASSDMVYALSRHVPSYGTSLCDGTSFAAPLISRLMDEVWRSAPTLTSEHLVSVLKDGLGTCSGVVSANTVPTTVDSNNTLSFNPAFLACAKQKAADAGTGGVSCTANPGGGAEALCAETGSTNKALCVAQGGSFIWDLDTCVKNYDCFESNCPCVMSCTMQCYTEICFEQCMANAGQDAQAIDANCSDCHELGGVCAI